MATFIKTVFCLVICLGLCLVNGKEYTGKIDLGKLRGVESTDRVMNEFIIVMEYNAKNWEKKSPVFVDYMKSTHPDSRLLNTFVIKDLIALHVHLMEGEAASLSEHADVNFVQANYDVRASQEFSSCRKEDTESRLWGLSRVSERELPKYSDAGYIYLSDDGDGVDAYVIDTGVLISHVEFEGRASHGFTATSIKEQKEGDSDENGHGTHVSGTIAGATYGAAKKANIIAVKVLNKDGMGTTADVLEGIQFVHNDFKKKKETRGDKVKVVVNMSLGGGPFAVGGADEAAITMATQDGVPFVVAAGNDAFDACFVSPSRISAAITVGATNIDDDLSYFSNYGPCVDILAPGESILSAYIGSDTASAIASGTSMASPHVAGIVARYLSQQEAMKTPATIKAWVSNLATDGAVALGTNIATPNSLLYMACLAGQLLHIDLS